MMGEESRAVELVDRLVSIGVEEREAKLFVHLVLNGPTRASDAAAAVHLKRTETYRALESLTKRGFVTAHLTKPVVYEAVAPDALFAELLAGHEQRRAELETLRERVAAAAASARDKRSDGAGRYGYKIVQGRRAILAALDPMIRNARSEVAMVSTVFSAQSTSAQNRAWQTLVRRASDGLGVKLLLCDTPGLESAMGTVLAHKNVQLRYLSVDHTIRFLAVDGREIMYWLVTDPTTGIDGRDDVAMWTNAPDFLRNQERLFQVLWQDAKEPARLAR